MKKILLSCLLAAAANALLLARPARAGTFAVGDVAVVEDTTGVAHQQVDYMNMMGPPTDLLAPGGRFCREAAKLLLPVMGDNYDGLFTFTPKMLDDLSNVQQGQPVRWSTQGIGTQPLNWGAQFGSAAKLSQCVFMGSLPRLPNNPDNPVTIFFGLPLGITGVELLGHEYGHHWMTWIYFDKNDGVGQRDTLRGYEANQNDPNSPGQLNGHYGYYTDSRSVMYGNFITDLGNGSFSVAGGQRKYGYLDQYLMGLRAPSEVPPTMVLDDGSHHNSAAGARAPGPAETVNNMTRVDVSVDDVIRAMGPRVPAYPNAQNCWRVAFVLVVPPGQTYNPADVAKVETYRARWQQWFTWATDGRGTMDARLSGNGCLRNPPPTDGGTVMPPMDGGSVEPEVDAGFNGEVAFATVPIFDDTPVVPVVEPPPPPKKDDTKVDLGTAKLRPGCNCSAGLEAVFLLGAVALLRRRRR